MPEDVRGAADIWQILRSKRGSELLTGLVDELAALHQLCGDLRRQIRELQIQQKFPGHLFALEDAANSASLRLPTRLEIRAGQLLEPQQGFYDLEYDPSSTPFRWTGPQRHFSFRVNIDRKSPLDVELDVLFMIDETRQRDLTLLVDGSMLPFRLEPKGSGYCGRAVLPAAEPQAATTLTFIVPQILRLGPGAADRREFGVAFHNLAIRPAAVSAPAMAKAPADGRIEAGFAGDAGEPADRLGQELPAATFTCTATDIRDGHPGFYSLEYDPDGVPFRWTGDQSNTSFSFSPLIDRRTPVELELRVISTIDSRRQSRLGLEVDGSDFALDLAPTGDRLEGRLVIPPREAEGPTSLTFTVPILLRPKGSDSRELGLAFGGLYLRPAAAPAAIDLEPSAPDHLRP